MSTTYAARFSNVCWRVYYFFGFLNNMTQHERSGLSQRVGGNDTRAIKRERHDSPPSVIVK